MLSQTGHRQSLHLPADASGFCSTTEGCRTSWTRRTVSKSKRSHLSVSSLRTMSLRKISRLASANAVGVGRNKRLARNPSEPVLRPVARENFMASSRTIFVLVTRQTFPTRSTDVLYRCDTRTASPGFNSISQLFSIQSSYRVASVFKQGAPYSISERKRNPYRDKCEHKWNKRQPDKRSCPYRGVTQNFLQPTKPVVFIRRHCLPPLNPLYASVGVQSRIRGTPDATRRTRQARCDNARHPPRSPRKPFRRPRARRCGWKARP